MIEGIVTKDGVPLARLRVAHEELIATVDTGFNGDIDLPVHLQGEMELTPMGDVESELAGGIIVEEPVYEAELEFDGELRRVLASFSDSLDALIGTGLLKDHQLRIDFPAKTVWISKLT